VATLLAEHQDNHAGLKVRLPIPTGTQSQMLVLKSGKLMTMASTMCNTRTVASLAVPTYTPMKTETTTSGDLLQHRTQFHTMGRWAKCSTQPDAPQCVHLIYISW